MSTYTIGNLKPDLLWLMSAMSPDMTRSISQIHYADGKAVATDGHRMHIIRDPYFPKAALDAPAANALIEVIKATHCTVITQGDDGAYRIAGRGMDLTLKTSPPAEFPEYRRVIPEWTETVEMTAAEIRKLPRNDDGSVYLMNAKGHTWKLNGAYVDDAIRGAGKGKIKVHFAADDLTPVGFEFANRFAVVMPMRK